MSKRKIIETNGESTKISCRIMGDFKSFHDSVHGHIKMDPLLVAIIDTPQYQRLRDIKQLGMAYWVFPGACHNRFEHGIGTSYLCGLMLSTLRHLHQTEYNHDIVITDTEILCVKIAGLCHDLGHGPFSHTFDGRFINLTRPGSNWTHEQASCDLFDHMVEANEELKLTMKKRGINNEEREFIKRLILGPDPRKDSIPEICNHGGKEMEKWFLYEIVSNKRTGIDCDKFDYFARDTHHLRIKNSFDFMRYFQNIRILAVDGQLQICVRDKEMFNLYELFHVRWALHHQVYQHKTAKAAEEMVSQALSKVDHIFQIAATIEDMERYTYLTDSIFFEILRSRDQSPCVEEAKKILKRVQCRKLYHLCGQINPNSTKRESEELSLSQPVTIDTEVIKDEILSQGNDCNKDDLFVDIISINYGMKGRNPVDNVVFFSKSGEPKYLRSDQLSDTLPQSFAEQHVRVYSTTEEKNFAVEEAFTAWCREKGYMTPNTLEGNIAGYFTDAKKSEVAKETALKERRMNLTSRGHVKRKLTMVDSNNNQTM